MGLAVGSPPLFWGETESESPWDALSMSTSGAPSNLRSVEVGCRLIFEGVGGAWLWA